MLKKLSLLKKNAVKFVLIQTCERVTNKFVEIFDEIGARICKSTIKREEVENKKYELENVLKELEKKMMKKKKKNKWRYRFNEKWNRFYKNIIWTINKWKYEIKKRIRTKNKFNRSIGK